MKRRLRATLAAFALLAAMPGSARADPYLLSGFALTPIKPGSLYLGAGFVEGLYSLPRFGDTRLIRTSIGYERVSERPSPVYAAPGWAAGFLFPEGSYPSFLGRNLRIHTTGTFWSSATGNTFFTAMVPGAPYTLTTIDGRVGLSTTTNGSLLRTTINTEHNRLDLALRIASDRPRPLFRGIVSTSLGLFGGWGYDKYFIYSIEVEPDVRHMSKLKEWVESRRIGIDGALSWTRPIAPNWDLNVAGRAGVYWIWATLNGVNCSNPGLNSTTCSFSGQAAFAGGEGFRVPALNDSDHIVGFLTTATVSLTWHLGFATARFGGFFTFETASAGVENPVAPAGTSTGTFVGAAHVKFKPAWSTGAFVTLKIPLYAVR